MVRDFVLVIRGSRSIGLILRFKLGELLFTIGTGEEIERSMLSEFLLRRKLVKGVPTKGLPAKKGQTDRDTINTEMNLHDEKGSAGLTTPNVKLLKNGGIVGTGPLVPSPLGTLDVPVEAHYPPTQANYREKRFPRAVEHRWDGVGFLNPGKFRDVRAAHKTSLDCRIRYKGLEVEL